MSKKLWLSTSFLLLIVILFISCSKDPDNDSSLNCNTVTNKAFAADIHPLVQNTCAVSSCHASGSANGPGALLNYSQISAASSQIRIAIANGTMPQGTTLTTAQKNSILCWIDSGAPNN